MKRYYVTKPDTDFVNVTLYYWGTKCGKVEAWTNDKYFATGLSYGQALKISRREAIREIVPTKNDFVPTIHEQTK